MLKPKPVVIGLLALQLAVLTGCSGEQGSEQGAGTGGAASSGDSGGSGGFDGGPPIVRACDGLPAPGAWERVSPPDSDYTTQVDGRCNGFGNQTDAFAIHPHDPATVYVASNCQGLWRTRDCGATWKHVTDGENADAVANGATVSLLLDPRDPDVIWVANIYEAGFWKSDNGGHDWYQPMPDEIRAAFVSGFIGAAAMDPTNPDHVIVAPHGACGDEWGGACVAETMDSGTTWRVVHVEAGWNEGSGPFIVNETTWGLATGGGIALTTDAGATWNVVSSEGVAVYGGVHRSPEGTYYVAVMSHGILMSEDAIHWTFPSDAPMCVAVVSTGERVVCGHQWSQLYFSASEGDLSTWEPFPAPGAGPDDAGAVWLGYDGVHHLLYTSRFRGGLWRMVLE